MAEDIVVQDTEKPHIEMPYLERIYTVTERFYNPNYGDGRICKCGHRYVEHFIKEEDYEPYGCCYCSCLRFKEVTYH